MSSPKFEIWEPLIISVDANKYALHCWKLLVIGMKVAGQIQKIGESDFSNLDSKA